MRLRADGCEIGVQLDDGKDPSVTQEKLCVEAISAFDPKAPPDALKGVELCNWRITVGIMPGRAGQNEKKKWVRDVAVYQEQPMKKVHLVATQQCFGDTEDDEEFGDLPRVIKFIDLQQQGELVGRFESCTEEDILWYLGYMAANRGALPATGVAFPSAEGYGLYGQKGGYDKEGKAIKIQKVD
jgi:hypothetical protein